MAEPAGYLVSQEVGIGVWNEADAMGRAELEARSIGGGDEGREDAGLRVDLAEGAKAADRGVVVVDVQPRGMHGKHPVVGSVGEIEGAGSRRGLDDVVEAGIAWRHALHL